MNGGVLQWQRSGSTPQPRHPTASSSRHPVGAADYRWTVCLTLVPRSAGIEPAIPRRAALLTGARPRGAHMAFTYRGSQPSARKDARQSPASQADADGQSSHSTTLCMDAYLILGIVQRSTESGRTRQSFVTQLGAIVGAAATGALPFASSSVANVRVPAARARRTGLLKRPSAEVGHRCASVGRRSVAGPFSSIGDSNPIRTGSGSVSADQPVCVRDIARVRSS